MSIYVGIDPGMSGFIAVLNPNGGIAKLHAIPTLPTGKGAKRIYNAPELWSCLRAIGRGAADAVGWERGEPYPYSVMAIIEKQQPMPRQGVSATFSTGFGYGLLCMALTAAKIPHAEVSASAWKRKMGLLAKADNLAARKKASKAKAIAKAQALFPGVCLKATERSRTPSSDKAEALLLAHYARCKALGLEP